MKNNLPENITGRKLESIQENLLVTSVRKHGVYDEKNKQGKYVSEHGFAVTARKLKPKFPNLNESTLRPWVKKHKEKLKEKAKQGQSTDFTPTIRNAGGQPLPLDEELDLKLHTMIITLQKAGTYIDVHVVRGVLNGLVCTNPEKCGRHIDF